MIELRFTDRNQILIHVGLKQATTRRSRHGNVGDWFELDGSRWEIRAIVPVSLARAAELFYRLEGEPDSGFFLSEWARAYGLRLSAVDLNQPVHVHVFARLPAPTMLVESEVPR